MQEFNFHEYDNLLHSTQKNDPRKKSKEKNSESKVCLLLFSAHVGDLETLKKYDL